MTTFRNARLIGVVGFAAACGCTARNVDFSSIQRPDRSDRLAAYDVFVGSWTWEAEMLNAAEPDRHWSGTAEWEWALDQRCLRGRLMAQSGGRNFEAEGIWSWHPRKRTYMWWMFNNWGYPQSGTARYDESTATWTMKYRSVGLDGTASYGRYIMKVVDNNTLEWRNEEWADALHLVKKMEMQGSYRRQP
jgi:hypothetical protein